MLYRSEWRSCVDFVSGPGTAPGSFRRIYDSRKRRRSPGSIHAVAGLGSFRQFDRCENSLFVSYKRHNLLRLHNRGFVSRVSRSDGSRGWVRSVDLIRFGPRGLGSFLLFSCPTIAGSGFVSSILHWLKFVSGPTFVPSLPLVGAPRTPPGRPAIFDYRNF
jgi:hypothetical protein